MAWQLQADERAPANAPRQVAARASAGRAPIEAPIAGMPEPGDHRHRQLDQVRASPRR